MKKYAVLHEPGDIVTLAGTRFVVLDVERRGSLPDSLFLLALESVGASEFGSSNNYAESDLKKAVDKWLEDMGKRGLDNAKLIPREIDLTTLDGSGCYGKLSVKAAPLTLDEAREYADIIPNAERWCRLVAPLSELQLLQQRPVRRLQWRLELQQLLQLVRHPPRFENPL